MSRTRKIYWSLGLLLFCQTELGALPSLSDFGDNPGALTAKLYRVKAGKPLVVLLHGCTQNGEAFAKQSGFLTQAQRQEFNLLIPQQNERNNPHLCFNWYSKDDYRKDQGESLSLKHAILKAKDKTQAKDIYIAGLSAGGAMTSIMLLNYPELFAAGAVIAGLPFPCADNLEQALVCMKKGPPPESLFAFRPNNQHQPERWPRLTVWFGTADKIVNPVNSHLLAQQWLSLTGVNPTATYRSNSLDGVNISQWPSGETEIQLQLVEIPNLGHGMPVLPQAQGGGESGPYLLSAPLSAAIAITKFWQLTG